MADSTPADFWNQRFSAEPDLYGARPNDWVARCCGDLSPGSRVLCLAEGQGRNALWLAARGHRVTAVDASAVAMSQLATAATSRGLAIDTVTALLPDWSPPAASFEAVVLIYAHFPPDVRALIHRQAARALVPGGLLVLEAFDKAQLGRSSGGPKDLAMLYDRDTLGDDFAMLQVEALAPHDAVLDEGPGHRGQARILRLRARAPD